MSGTVFSLHPTPEGRHKECEHFCSAGVVLDGIFPACQRRCAKSDEFQAECAAEAQADRVRFARRVELLHVVRTDGGVQ